MQRFRSPPTTNRTFFQQKWSAKAVSRAYHGEQVREGQWKRMFNHRIRSVIPMNASDLAADDGTLVSSGRGSGLDKGGKPAYQTRPTPYTHMTFAPLERRLDVAIFRALFASSARQARQFVIHGAVTVNGQKMKHPSYLLNPGDLFQVEPERVLYATGHTKTPYERRQGRRIRRRAKAQRLQEAEAAEGAPEAEAESTETAKEDTKGTEKEDSKEPEKEDIKETLRALLARAKSVMSAGKETLAPQRKQELRGFQQAVRRVLSRSESSTVLADSLEAQFSQLTLLLKAKRSEKPEKKEVKPRPADAFAFDREDTEVASAKKDTEAIVSDKLSEAFAQATLGNEVDASELSDEEFDTLKRALTQMRDNPLDNSKTYSTPWQPRQYMSAFAFIPRYLEVNQNICAAVYLRHPVARPGSAEVPTPFGESIATPAYGWYLRRRW
ncbi:30S ribosomal subunit S4, putative [Penicillium digitatum PHI26]|uniref:Small ribosomal subunit protein uS4m n=3 Tax=Penicillium digitatum TaxID=36651 RepID=K9GIH2_PEND2|nr:30S ribosomal subunit S4, putative [Penicillium digitatum Pd1]EKV12996.1 30S ribosomal subunit S4, putative [Penicillium digitatum PHI26]EKV18789.1 30S ribosomal subunit S4, putative [Penicillium digitatum Pd1]